MRRDRGRGPGPYLAGALFAGGIAVGLSRRREYMLRWCAWAVGVPVVVAALYVGPGGAAALAASAGVACALEYGGLAAFPGWTVRRLPPPCPWRL
ncbi:hypothetical protein ACFQY7_46880 [Actinomadura luteofluorescens]|uniref:hypothetical protein n=1 Tax=Actinomadura luteofluorescens TaxID=46163 RepID=UPI00363EF52C